MAIFGSLVIILLFDQKLPSWFHQAWTDTNFRSHSQVLEFPTFGRAIFLHPFAYWGAKSQISRTYFWAYMLRSEAWAFRPDFFFWALFLESRSIHQGIWRIRTYFAHFGSETQSIEFDGQAWSISSAARRIWTPSLRGLCPLKLPDYLPARYCSRH